MSAGLMLAVVAMLAWAVGDWSIQRGTRLFGDWATLFLIGLVGLIALFPFAYPVLPTLTGDQWWFFLLLGLLTLVGALFLFEGLKRGKIAVIEPVFGLELPFTVLFSVTVGGEHLALATYLLIAALFLGLLLAVTKHLPHLHFHRTIFERGVFWAMVGAVGMGLMNFLTGVGSQTVSPLVTIWFVHSFLAVSCGLYLLARGGLATLWRQVWRHPGPALGAALADNVAWVAYAISMTLIPISIATAISESYIILVVLLGLLANGERLRRHQGLGVVLAVLTLLVLARQAV